MPLYRKNNKLWGCDKTKGLGLGVVNCGAKPGNVLGKLMEGEGYFSRSVCMVPFSSQALAITLFSLWCQAGALLTGNVCPALRCKGESRELSLHLLFLKGLQLRIMPKWHIGVACSEPFSSCCCSRDHSPSWSLWSSGLGPVGWENDLSLCAGCNTNLLF